jgi:membrane-bound serine protease (ClpP class)
LEAGDVAAMADGTNTGAASPVLIGHEMDPVMRKKVENDAAAGLRSLIAKRGRNVELAETAIREARSFSDTEALRDHLIDVTAPNEQQLLQKLNGTVVTRFDGRKQTLDLTGAVVTEYHKTIREQIVSAISDPNIALVLLILGILCVYVEFTTPGMVAPGVVGGIAVLLALSALSVFPVNWSGAALILLAFACFVLEAKFMTHGVLGVGGAVAMILGSLLLIDAPAELRIRPATAIAISLPFAAISVFLMTLAIRARANKALTGKDAMIDDVAVARTPLNPTGKILLHGEYWDAESSRPVEAGACVRIVAVEGLKVKVIPCS